MTAPDCRVTTLVCVGLLLAAGTGLLSARATQASPVGQGAAPTIEVVNDKKKFNLLAAGHALFVLVTKGTVARIEAKATDVAGGLSPGTAVSFEGRTGSFVEGAWVELPMTIDLAQFRDIGPGSHDVGARVDAYDSKGTIVTTTPATLTLVRTERQLAPGKSPVPLSVRRWGPLFWEVATTHCIQLHATPAGTVEPPIVQSGELYGGIGATAMVLPGAMVNGEFRDCPEKGDAATKTQSSTGGALKPVVVTSTLPAGVTKGTATLKLLGPDLKANTELALQINTKDLLVWPLLVVLAATLLSNRVHHWIASGRSSSINLADMSQMADDLHNLRKMKPSVEQTPEYEEVRRLLATAARQQARDDVQGCATTLASARQKLDALFASAGVPVPTVALGMPTIVLAPGVVIETPESERTTGRVLTFSISGTVPTGATVVWEIGIDDQWRTLDVIDDPSASGVRWITKETIREAGVYGVRLVVGGTAQEATTFRVAPTLTERTLRTVKQTDYSIDVLAAAITALITTAALWELDAFGTFRDYVLQFAGAFGVTESVKGFAQVLGAVRKV